MDWRVAVIDERRFCIVGTFDLTFDECAALSDRYRGFIKVPHRLLASVGSFEVTPDRDASYSMQIVRGQKFYKNTGENHRQEMLHVVVASEEELSGLRKTGRFRDWDADLRQPKSSR